MKKYLHNYLEKYMPVNKIDLCFSIIHISSLCTISILNGLLHCVVKNKQKPNFAVLFNITLGKSLRNLEF